MTFTDLKEDDIYVYEYRRGATYDFLSRAQGPNNRLKSYLNMLDITSNHKVKGPIGSDHHGTGGILRMATPEEKLWLEMSEKAGKPVPRPKFESYDIY